MKALLTSTGILALALAAPLPAFAAGTAEQGAEQSATDQTATDQTTTDQAAAGEDATAQQAGAEAAEPIVALDGWEYSPLYATAWSAERVMDDAEVIGIDGEEIGDVENLLLGTDGEVLALIAEVGGFWDIGDTHVAVPWDEVEISADASTLTVPVDEENVGDYSVWADDVFNYHEAEQELSEVDDDLFAGIGVMKATDVIGDYAYLTGGDRYGWVNDVLVQDGSIAAVVVDAAAYGTPGFYAYPYGTYGYGMTDWAYPLPYGADEVTVVETFDYETLERDSGAEEDSAAES